MAKIIININLILAPAKKAKPFLLLHYFCAQIRLFPKVEISSAFPPAWGRGLFLLYEKGEYSNVTYEFFAVRPSVSFEAGACQIPRLWIRLAVSMPAAQIARPGTADAAGGAGIPIREPNGTLACVSANQIRALSHCRAIGQSQSAFVYVHWAHTPNIFWKRISHILFNSSRYPRSTYLP